LSIARRPLPATHAMCSRFVEIEATARLELATLARRYYRRWRVRARITAPRPTGLADRRRKALAPGAHNRCGTTRDRRRRRVPSLTKSGKEPFGAAPSSAVSWKTFQLSATLSGRFSKR
jgi:hypothetical protein